MKKRRLKNKFSVAFATVAVTAVLIFSVVKICQLCFPDCGFNGFVPAPFGGKVAENVKIAQGLQIPEWIDSQIINIHSSARTGIHLVDVKNIVVHYVGNPNSSAQNNRDYFNKPSTGVSSHFIVGLEGEIIQCVPLWEKSAASNNRNIDTISIEVCHKDEGGEFGKETYESVIRLCVWLCNNFSLDERDIIRHYDITEKICPKYYVENPKEWKKLKEDVGKELKSYEKKD